MLKYILMAMIACLGGCQSDPWNQPYHIDDAEQPVLVGALSAAPEHLDPARAYSSNEWGILGQVVDPLLQYHYTDRPYRLIPGLLEKMPTVRYWAADKQTPLELATTASWSEYVLTLTPNTHYHEHPAFVPDNHHLSDEQLADYDSPHAFEQQATRAVSAHDVAYQIKRLADPNNASPIFGMMSQYIDGLSELREQLTQNPELDLASYALPGAVVQDEHTLSLWIKGYYPQFMYWLSMPFFSPMPPEVVQLYESEALKNNNLSLDTYPIGTGAYYIEENDPNYQVILKQNPHHPTAHQPNHIKMVQLRMEKESLPYWHKFLQGYYDLSGISSDSFDMALTLDSAGLKRSERMREQGIQLQHAVMPATYYWGFNMLDEVVGSNRSLRQAIAIAIDIEEYIQIFLNGRGEIAHSPLPPGLLGHQSTRNPVLYDEDNKRDISEAKALMVKAGYPNGIDPETQQPLTLYFDTPAVSSGARAQNAWLKKQFDKLGIQLVVRATQYNRFQEKVRQGEVQFFSWGWNADYPDPENFLFLLYGPNGKVHHGGENASNFDSPEFNAAFESMRQLPDGPEKSELLQHMVHMLQEDSPWIFGYHPSQYLLVHQWIDHLNIHPLAHNTYQHWTIDVAKRAYYQKQWNQPKWMPLGIIAGLGGIIMGVIWSLYRQRQQALGRRPG